MGSWYVMWWCLPSWWNLAFPSSGLEGKNSCTLKRGGSRFLHIFGSIYQTSWSHIPWLYSQQTEVPITYHMARFNIHEHQDHWTGHQIPQKICGKFLTSQTTWWCPPSERCQHWEFIAVVYAGVTLTGGPGCK